MKKSRVREADSKNETLRQLIAEKAYELYQQRGQMHGSDLDDWLNAEREVLGRMPGEAQTASEKISSRRRTKGKSTN